MADRPIYRGMTQAELDRAYDNRRYVANYETCLDRWAEDSAALYHSATVYRDLRYGPGARHRLDFFPAQSVRRPTIFFIHGGYWQWCDKEDESFVARGPLAHDINVAIVEYTLCPNISLGGIVAEIHSALDWLIPSLGALDADPNGLILAGSSAGAHLAAMMSGRPDVRGALLVSGLYDLEPVRLLGLNAAIGLNSFTAAQNSPILNLPANAGPACFAIGEQELPEMLRQTDDYRAAWTARGLPGWETILSGVDHFTIMDEMAAPEGRLTSALLELCRLL